MSSDALRIGGKRMSLLLWAHGAPLAKGNDTEDCPSITPYLVESGHPPAAVIVCPGGGYQMRADHEGRPVAKWLNKQGISAFVLNYRVAPYKHPSPLSDAQRGIRTVRHKAHEWNIDPRRIGILGFSAGGHLASSAGMNYDSGNSQAADPVERESCRPDLMVLCYPVITFGEYRHHGSMVNLIGEDATEERRLFHSNETKVTKDTPPTFMWHTADDDGVPAENCLLLAMALSRCQIPYELHVYQNGPHGLGLAGQDKQVGTWPGLCALWLKKQGF